MIFHCNKVVYFSIDNQFRGIGQPGLQEMGLRLEFGSGLGLRVRVRFKVGAVGA
jgi:hypothetical protein